MSPSGPGVKRRGGPVGMTLSSVCGGCPSGSTWRSLPPQDTHDSLGESTDCLLALCAAGQRCCVLALAQYAALLNAPEAFSGSRPYKSIPCGLRPGGVGVAVGSLEETDVPATNALDESIGSLDIEVARSADGDTAGVAALLLTGRDACAY